VSRDQNEGQNHNVYVGSNTFERVEQFIRLGATLTCLLTPWCRVLLEELTGLQLVKKFPAFHGTRRFITALTSVRHLSLSWASPIQSIYPHPTSWRSILGATLTNQNSFLEGIKSRLKLGNSCCYSVRNFYLPVFYREIQKEKYTELLLCLLFCTGVKLGFSH